jgi:hypothetical protein
MREVIILQAALQESRRIMREASTVVAGESPIDMIKRITEASHQASRILLEARIAK